MLEFRPVSIADREMVTAHMRCAGFRGSDYTFANLYNWAEVHNICIAEMGGLLIVRNGRENYGYLFPVGEGDVRPALEEITEMSHRLGHTLVHYNMPREAMEALDALYPGRFTFREQRDNFDYIYTRESLAGLAGKKLHGKRNHIARFKAAYPDWHYEPLTTQNLNEAWEMSLEWCRQKNCMQTASLRQESCAVYRAFQNFEAESLVGGLLRVGGRVVAFTMGSPVTEDTFVVHIEKAFSDVQGAYPMINQQFVQNALEGYTYVNREDDLGDEGLRRAKLSYYPAFLYERFEAIERPPL